ncbi:MAG: putative drug exporter of the superfamily [Solirubrobacterales bacterium]|nr:putative drug exporter of the superfamily [Solirubrobacterales bacterium]
MNPITHLALRHRRLVALAWVGLAVAGVLTLSSTTGSLTHTFATPGNPGYDTNHQIQQRFGLDGNEQPTIAVLQLPPGQSMRTPVGQATAARTFAAVPRAGRVGVADYANTHNPKLVSADGRTTWALIDMPNPDVPLGQGVIDRIAPVLRAAAPAGATVSVTGFEQLQSGGGGGGPSTLVETLIGMVGALVILVLVFGSAIAVVPLLMAIASILISFLLVGALEQVTAVSFLVEYLVALIGLGVAIDYSLLVVTRWREERERGLDNEAAIRAAGATAGHAVVLSGLTVAVGLLSLIVLPVPFLRSIGLGGMLIPLVALAAAVTLLPVTLAAWGPALDRHRIHRTSTSFSRGWARWGRLVVRRRWVAGAAGLAIIVALAAPALSMNTGQPSTTAFSTATPAARTLQSLGRQGVPSAVVFPVQVLTHGGAAGAARVAAIANSTPGVYTSLAPATPSFRHGNDALVSVIPRAQGSTTAGKALVDALRSRMVSVPGGAEVGGNTAQNKDFVSAVYGNFPLMLGVIALLTFLLLARAFRSIVLAAKAVVLNVISLGASYGFLVLFWQQGHGSSFVYGVPATGAIRDFIPILVFAFLFGLSMDYEVFLLARMREEYDHNGSTPKAIVGALGHTGRLVTSGALILALSFLSLSTNPDLPVRVIATGLALGILLDAFIVRTLLVPALVALMGRWNWWMPARLGRMLRIPETADDPARA